MEHVTEWFSDRAVIVHFQNVNVQAFPPLVKKLQEVLPHTQVRNGMTSIIVETRHCDVTLLSQVSTIVDQYQPPLEMFSSNQKTAHVITVNYSGLDLDTLSELLNLPVLEIIHSHQETVWEVAMTGFAPGFGYLVPKNTGVLWEKIPRLAVPRQKVPTGSVAVASGMSAIYPQSMPGGWHILGYTDIKLFNPHSPDPMLLHPGDIVKFKAVS